MPPDSKALSALSIPPRKVVHPCRDSLKFALAEPAA
jgi:hypothetical protein